MTTSARKKKTTKKLINKMSAPSVVESASEALFLPGRGYNLSQSFAYSSMTTGTAYILDSSKDSQVPLIIIICSATVFTLLARDQPRDRAVCWLRVQFSEASRAWDTLEMGLESLTCILLCQ